jgi:hypothetical protein
MCRASNDKSEEIEGVNVAKLQMRSRVRRLPVFIGIHKGSEIHHLCQVTRRGAVGSVTW